MDGEPPQEEDFSTIPLVDRSVHKNWKARLHAYNDVIAKAGKTASDSDPFFRPFLDSSLLKKWCLDANAVAQEKGTEAALAIVTNSGESSARLRPEVVPALVEKGVGNTRAGTKKKAVELCAMFVEVENGGDGVITDVIAGLDAKAPKTVAGTVTCLKEITESFGVPGIGNVKPLLKVLPKIFGHSDKNVRAEGTALTLVLYSYLGPALLPALSDLKPVQMSDLQKSFDGLDAEGKGAGTGKPTRWTRKVQREREVMDDGQDDGDGAAVAEEPAPIDPMSLLDPVDVYKLFPDNLMEQLGSSKWKERLESLEECNKVLAEPRNARIAVSNVDAYGNLVQTLGVKCHKDSNVNVVMESARLLEGLARGLGKPFGRYRNVTMSGMLERLKERKATVVEALAKSLDAIFLTTTLQDVVDDILTSLKSKNPQVKEGTLNFLHRSLQVTLDAPGKDQVQPMAEALVALLSDSAEPVRTAAAECLGTMMKILGERTFNPYIENVSEIQMTKVKDAFGRAQIKYRTGGPKAGTKPPAARAPAAAAPSKAPVRKAPNASPPIKSSGKFDNNDLLDEFAPPARAPPARFQRPGVVSTGASAVTSATPSPPPQVAPSRAPPARLQAKAAPTAAVGPSKPAAKPPVGVAKTLASAPTDPIKYRYSPEEAAARAEEAIPANYHTALADPAWKVRLEAADEMVKWVGEDGGAEQVDSEVLMRFLSKTPGWGEKNFQVSAKLYQVMQLMAERIPSFGKPAASLIIGPLSDKLGDMKLKKPAGDALTTTAEKTSLAFVLAQSYEPMTKQKAPKAQADALTWIKQQVIDFGIAGVPLRELISFIKGALGSPNATVRSSATALLVQVKIFVGGDISGFIEDLNPQLLATINKEFDKVAGQTAPEPTRTQADLREAKAGPGKAGKGGADPLDDLIPRVDLDKLVAQTTVINDARSDAWKVRKEAFESLSALLDVKSNSRLKPSMGEIATVLKKAMGDTNLAVKMLALGIISKIATGMGQPFEKYSRIVVAAVASVCADQKATTRTAAVNTLGAIADACGSLDSMYSGLGASLESTNPALRTAVLTFIGDRLTEETPSPSSDLAPLAAPLVTCLEDRNGDVRKAAGGVLPFVVASAGYDFVMDQTSRLKPASKATIMPLINNARDAANKVAAPPVPKTTAATPARASLKPPPKVAPATPRAAPAASILKPSLGNLGAGRSIAMKSLSAPGTRPASSMSSQSDERSAAPKSRMAPPRSLASSTSAPPQPSSERTLPFTTSNPEARMQRLKRDATRWNFESGARKEMLDYLQQQIEPHTSPEFTSLLFSKDHKAEEDFMAALAAMTEFYDADTASSFGLSHEQLRAIELANVDLALKYSSLRLLGNNTQVANRCLEVITNVLDTVSQCGERLSEVEVKVFVPALVIKLGDPKFGPKLAAIFDGLDKLIPASQVVQLLVLYGLEDKTAGKTCRNESLLLIEKAFRKRGSVLRKDDRAFFEAVAKCIADQGTRQAALTLMALLQLQGESRILQAVIEAMPTSSKDMLANRRATMAAAKGGAGHTRGAPSESESPRSAPTPAGQRLSRELGNSGASSPGPGSRPASRASRLPPPSTPTRGISAPSGMQAPRATSALPAPTQLKRPTRPAAEGTNGGAAVRPSMQPLARPMAPPAPAAPPVSEATMLIEAIRTTDIEEAAEALKAMGGLIEEEDGAGVIPEARGLIDVLTYQLELLSGRESLLMDPRNLRRVKHLMRVIHLAFTNANIAKRFKLEPMERLFMGIRAHYALLEEWSEGAGKNEMKNNSAAELRDYISMVLSAIISTPSRELVYSMLFHALVDLCQDMTPTQDKRLASEIGVVLQCTYKRVRSIDADLRNNRVSAGALLAIIEDLLQVIPPVQWRRRPKFNLPHGDLPLRVVKTLLQRVIVYTKEINVGIYDLLQDQFGAEADMTTVYSYIFRISSASDDAAPAAAASALAPLQTAPPPEPSRRRSNGHERPASMASSARMSVADMPVPTPKSPTRDVTEAERLVRRLTDPRDSEQRLNELYTFMKSSPENETEARTAISAILNPAAQTFVWRALDRRSGDAEPRSPVTASPVRSPIREYHSPPLAAPVASQRSSLSTSTSNRPQSVGYEGLPVEDKLAALNAMFRNRTRTSTGGASAASGGSADDSSRSSPIRPLSDIEPRSAQPPSSNRPRSEVPQVPKSTLSPL